ncbi:MAG: MarR family transcriptional regulator [Candidatus Competibacteraceae bacterium]
MAIDLINSIPPELAESADLDELLHAVRSIEQWQDRHAQVLDYIYCHRLLRLLRTRAPLTEAIALYDHLAHVNHARRRAELNGLEQRRYAERWRAYQDLLDDQITVLSSDVPQQALQRTHALEIVALVKSGQATTQQAIQEQLGLKEANLSRILKLLEANELIVRRKKGRENHLLPGPALARVELPQETTAPHETESTQHIPRFASYLKVA